MAVLRHDRLDWDAVDALVGANGIAEAARTLRERLRQVADPGTTAIRTGQTGRAARMRGS